ncbi:MAG: hypothetical protein ACKOWW_07690 [Flavobacteriales bacterium]
MKYFFLVSLLFSLFACTKFETAKPTISMTRTGLSNEDVKATANYGSLSRQNVLFYGIQLDTLPNNPIDAYAYEGLPCPLTKTSIYDGSSGFFVPGNTYYLRSFAALKTGEMLVSERFEFVY